MSSAIRKNIEKRFGAFSMKSISSRLAAWYALAATTTLACLFVTGYFILEQHFIHGLDLLLDAHFVQIRQHLARNVNDFQPDDPAFVERRVRGAAERTAALFYLQIRNERTGHVFHSRNLKNRNISGDSEARSFNSTIPGLGELRIGVYKLAPLTITIGTPLESVRARMERYATVSLFLLAGMMVASVGIGFLLSRLALRPVQVISQTANRIRSDNLTERIPVSEVQDEIADLATMLNQMFDRLESSFNHIRRFTAEASHELKTPLSLVRLYSERLLLRGGLDPVQEEDIQLQLEELSRVELLLEEMLFLSRAEANAVALDLVHENPARFLQSFSQDAKVLAEGAGCCFSHIHEGEGSVAFDRKRIRQVLLNLLTNAVRVSPAQGRITLRSVLENDVWHLSFEDEGPGLPASLHERIFERFVRVDRMNGDEKGLGLGLALCRSIVTLHHGRIFATSPSSGRGLHVKVEIPAV